MKTGIKIKVVVDEDLMELATGFLHAKRDEISVWVNLLKEGHLEELQTKAHCLKGVAGSYGLLDVSRLAGKIEETLVTKDLDQVAEHLAVLSLHLYDIELTKGSVQSA